MKIAPRLMTDSQVDAWLRAIESELEDCTVTIRQMQLNTAIETPARVALIEELSRRERRLYNDRLSLHREKDRRNGHK